jgi:hypothetical protein
MILQAIKCDICDKLEPLPNDEWGDRYPQGWEKVITDIRYVKVEYGIIVREQDTPFIHSCPKTKTQHRCPDCINKEPLAKDIPAVVDCKHCKGTGANGMFCIPCWGTGWHLEGFEGQHHAKKPKSAAAYW